MVNSKTNALEINVQTTLDKLNKTLEMLEKKENVLVKKAAAWAKEFTRAKNRRAAIQCLKRKRLYEQQIEQLANFQSRILDQMIMLETIDIVDALCALRTEAVAMKAMQKVKNIDDVGKTMVEINGQTENMKQILEALSASIDAVADFDKDELEEEHGELEVAELEEELLQPATTVPVVPVSVPAGQQPVGTLSRLLFSGSRLPFSGSSLPFSAEFLLLLLALVCMKLLSRMMSFIY